MDEVIYVIVSLLGVFLCHFFSEKISNPCRFNSIKRKFYISCYVVSLIGFSYQHYGIFFESHISNDWFFIVSFDSNIPSEIMRWLGFLFLTLTVLTPPPSKLKLLYYVLFKTKKNKF